MELSSTSNINFLSGIKNSLFGLEEAKMKELSRALKCSIACWRLPKCFAFFVVFARVLKTFSEELRVSCKSCL